MSFCPECPRVMLRIEKEKMCETEISQDFIPFHFYISSSFYPSIHPSSCPLFDSSVYPPFLLSIHLSTHPFINPLTHPSIHPSNCLSIHLFFKSPFHSSMHPSTLLFVYPSILSLLSIHLSKHSSTHPRIHPSILSVTNFFHISTDNKILSFVCV